MTNADPKLRPGQLTFTIQEAAELLGISKSTAYEAAHRGELPILRFGRRLVVTRTTLETLLGLSGQPPRTEALGKRRSLRTRWMRVPDGVKTARPDRPLRRAGRQPRE
jgi:excisionase family DNA binding protein